MADNKIDVSVSPTRNMASISIPYGEFLIRLSVSLGQGSIFEEDIEILKRDSVGAANCLKTVTSEVITKFNRNCKIKPTGDNLMNVMELVHNLVNS